MKMTPEQNKAVDDLIEFIDERYLDRDPVQQEDDRKLIQLLLKCRASFTGETLPDLQAQASGG